MYTEFDEESTREMPTWKSKKEREDNIKVDLRDVGFEHGRLTLEMIGSRSYPVADIGINTVELSILPDIVC
jgi:hypothetical protein